jgi:hypothetical protein
MLGASLEQAESALKGDNPYVFRVAQTQLDQGNTPSVRVSGKFERTSDELFSIEPTFSSHRAVTGMPFPATYFSLDKVYQHLEMPNRVHIDKVEQFVGQQIKSRRLSDTAKAAVRVIQDLEKKLSLNEDHDPYYRLERMANHIDALRLSSGHTKLRMALKGKK